MTNRKNAQPDFESTIERSFKAPWKHKALWFYGILLAIFAAGGSLPNLGDSADEKQMQKVGNSLSSVPVQTWIIIGAVVAVVVLTFVVIGLIVSSWSQAALVNGAILLNEGKDFTRKEIGQTGKGPVWRLIKLNFFIPLLIILAILIYSGLILGVSLVIGGEIGGIFGIVLGIASILVIVPFLIYYGIVWLMASRFVVTEEIGAFQSLKKAQDLLKGNFWMTFLLSLVANLISGVGGAAWGRYYS